VSKELKSWKGTKCHGGVQGEPSPTSHGVNTRAPETTEEISSRKKKPSVVTRGGVNLLPWVKGTTPSNDRKSRHAAIPIQRRLPQCYLTSASRGLPTYPLEERGSNQAGSFLSGTKCQKREKVSSPKGRGGQLNFQAQDWGSGQEKTNGQRKCCKRGGAAQLLHCRRAKFKTGTT